MPILDQTLKAKIEQDYMSDSHPENDVVLWLKDWVSFCFDALVKDELQTTFDQILDAKITQKRKGELLDFQMVHCCRLKYFFTHLFLESNATFNWFAEN